MSHKIFHCTHRVSYAECTVGNHVYHARYLDMLERARGEFFRSMDCPLLQLQEQDAIFPVVECQMKFHAMARYDEVLRIGLWLTELGRARFSCAGRIEHPDGTVLFDSVLQLACTTVGGKIRRLPAPLVAGLREYLAPVNAEEPRP